MTRTTPPPIIALVGPTKSGKSQVAKYLMHEHGFRLAPMAGPLKQMLIAGGLRHCDVYGDTKETPSALLGGRTPRYAMQTLGTEWGRDIIGPDIWVNMWIAAYNKVYRSASPIPPQPVVVDDVRFDNEVAAVKSLGGIIVEVCRPGKTYSKTHRSEKGVGIIDERIHNTGSLDHLRRQAVDLATGQVIRV